MAHSFVFDTAGSHACSCQSNGGLAKTIIKYIVKLTSVLLNPGKNMRGCRQCQKHQRSEPSIHFLIYGFVKRSFNGYRAHQIALIHPIRTAKIWIYHGMHNEAQGPHIRTSRKFGPSKFASPGHIS